MFDNITNDYVSRYFSHNNHNSTTTNTYYGNIHMYVNVLVANINMMNAHMIIYILIT